MKAFKGHQSLWRGTLGVTMILFAALALSSCYPDYGLTVTDYDAVATYHAPGTDYGAYSTFFLIDSVMHTLPPGTADDIPRTYDQTILTSVENNLEAAGYVRTLDPLLADIVVQTSLTRQEYMVYYGWGGYYGWDWYWPGYYPPVYGYSYSTGTIVVDMADVVTSTASDQVTSVWMAILQGLADVTTGSATETRIRNGINQAFIQSPYLGAN
jgi:Domain of unknown function (DUF4136)